MKHLTATLLAFAFAIPLFAGVPQRWTVETTRVQPATFDVVRGETIALEASFNNAGKPFAMDGYDCSIFWQTNGMGSAWWTAPAAAASNRVSATFTPEMDPGASTVIGFLGSTGQIYRASFQLRFRHGPGATPNALPLPVPVIDFAKVRVLNPPWESGGGGGVDTNAVEQIANKAIETNKVTVALVSATNDLTSTKLDKTDPILMPTAPSVDAPETALAGAQATGAALDEKLNAGWERTYFEDRGMDYAFKGAAYRADEAGVLLDRPNQKRLVFGTLPLFEQYGLRWGVSDIDGFYGYVPFAFVTDLPDISRKADRTELNPIKTDAENALAYSRANFDYMSGNTNAWFSGTNYVIGAESTNRTTFAFEDGMNLGTVPCSMALWEIRDGKKQCVWDQRDWTTWYWNFKIDQYRREHDRRDAALRSLMAGCAPTNWSSRTACGLTNPVSDTTWFDTSKVVLSAGYAWQHQLTVDGVGYWGIEGNGCEIGGSGTNATLRITDWEGNEVFKITKGSARLAYIDKSSNVATGWDGGYMWFDMKTGDPANGIPAPQPMGEFTIDLREQFYEEGDNCPAEVREYEDRGNGVWRCYFRAKPGINANACFARFKVQTGTETTVEYANAPTINGGLIFNGRKIAPVIPANAAVGDTITWKVVQ